MGLYDRDYYRNDAAGRGLADGVSPITSRLIAVNIGVFVAQLLTLHTSWSVTRLLQLDPERALGGFQVWRFVTYAFCHDPGSLWHIVMNMVFLWIFGRHVEPIYGPREFLRFYLAAALVSGLAHMGFSLALDDVGPLVGASGAVMGVAMLCALYYPTLEIRLMLVIPVQIRWIVAMWVVLDLFPLLHTLGGTPRWDRVSHVGHLSGLLYGYLYKRFDLRFSQMFAGWRWPSLKSLARSVAARRNPNVKLYRPPDDRRAKSELDRQVDEILAKISAQGESSLTDSERTILKEASQRYKRQ